MPTNPYESPKEVNEAERGSMRLVIMFGIGLALAGMLVWCGVLLVAATVASQFESAAVAQALC